MFIVRTYYKFQVEMGWTQNWISTAQDRKQWKHLIWPMSSSGQEMADDDDDHDVHCFPC